MLPPADFESAASTDSAIPAAGGVAYNGLPGERSVHNPRIGAGFQHAPAMDLTVDDFDYALPAELIAQFPLAERTASHLLVVAGERREDRRFAELPTLLRRGDLLVINANGSPIPKPPASLPSACVTTTPDHLILGCHHD